MSCTRDNKEKQASGLGIRMTNTPSGHEALSWKFDEAAEHKFDIGGCCLLAPWFLP